MFLILEHPNEKEKMLTFQKLVLNEREIFLNLVFNLTSTLSSDELQLLNEIVNDNYNDLNDNLAHPDFDLSPEERFKSYMLATNRLHLEEGKTGLPFLTSNQNVNQVIERLDKALLSYENVIASSAGEGIDMKTKDFEYRWTYVQSIFFTSTIITTVGKYHTFFSLRSQGAIKKASKYISNVKIISHSLEVPFL